MAKKHDRPDPVLSSRPGRHLRRLLKNYFVYYHRSRTHLALAKDAPAGRVVMPRGEIIAFPEVGGLHHRYERRAA